MFNPNRSQAREFLFDLWEKHRAGATLTPLESMALAIVLEHPEYHGHLEERERYLDRDWRPEGGEGSRGDRKGGEDSDGTHGFCMLFSLDLQREIITQACPKSASQVFGGESQ